MIYCSKCFEEGAPPKILGTYLQPFRELTLVHVLVYFMKKKRSAALLVKIQILDHLVSPAFQC